MMNSINAYIEKRRMLEAPRGTEDNFAYVTLKDIKNLAKLSNDLRDNGYLVPGSKDMEIIGKIFGMDKKLTLDTLSGFWSEAKWPVTIGIPMFPGTTKGRVKIHTRGATVEDARPIPLIAALMTLAEPPWLAPLSGFNVMDSNSAEPAEALAEDTLFGIKGIFNPENQPETPAIALHLKDYIENQYERRISGEESLQRAVSFGKGMSMMYGMNNIFGHPVFTYGATGDEIQNWQNLVQNVFNAKAFKRDEISYEGIGKGTGWINYILFGYTLYGHLGRRVGPFAPGLAQAYQTLNMLRELDDQWNGRLFKIIRWIQLTGATPIANGLSNVDYRVAASLAKAFGKIPNGDKIVDDMLMTAVKNYINSFSDRQKHIAVKTLQIGDKLLGQNTIPSDINIQEPVLDDKINIPDTGNLGSIEDLNKVKESLKDIYSDEEISRLEVSMTNLSTEDKIEAFKTVLKRTNQPLQNREIIFGLWKNKYNVSIPYRIIRTPALQAFLERIIKLSAPVLAVITSGWGAALLPLVLLITEGLGIYKGSAIKKWSRLAVGVVFIFIYGAINPVTLVAPSIILLLWMLMGGERMAKLSLYVIDMLPKTFMRASNLFANFLDIVSGLTFYNKELKREHATFNKDLILNMVRDMGTEFTNAKDFNNLFNKRFLLTHYREKFLNRLGDIFPQDEIAKIKSGLSKYDLTSQLQILRRIYERAKYPYPDLAKSFKYAMKPKPGEKLEYKGRLISFFSEKMSQKSFGKIMTAVSLIAINAVHIALFGIPSTLNDFGLMAFESGVALTFGTSSFVVALGSTLGVIIPLLHYGLIGLSASIFPVLLIFIGFIAGYLGGTTMGIVISNIPEIIRNSFGYAKRLLSFPIKHIGLAISDTDRKKEIIMASISPLLRESNTAQEFIDKFESLYVETLDNLRGTDNIDDASREEIIDYLFGKKDDGDDKGPDAEGPTGVAPTGPIAPTSPQGTTDVTPEAEDVNIQPQSPAVKDTAADLKDLNKNISKTMVDSGINAAYRLYNSEYKSALDSYMQNIIGDRQFMIFPENPKTDLCFESIIRTLESEGILKIERRDDGSFAGFEGPIGISVSSTPKTFELIVYLDTDGIKLGLSKFTFDIDSLKLEKIDSSDEISMAEHKIIFDSILGTVREGVLPHPSLKQLWNVADLETALNKSASDVADPDHDIALRHIGDLRSYMLEFALNTGMDLNLGNFIKNYGENYEKLYKQIKDKLKSPSELNYELMQGIYKKFEEMKKLTVRHGIIKLTVTGRIDDIHFSAKDQKGNDYTVRILDSDAIRFINQLPSGKWESVPELSSFHMIDNAGIGIIKGILDANQITQLNDSLSMVINGKPADEGKIADETPEPKQQPVQTPVQATPVIFTKDVVLPLYRNTDPYFNSYNHVNRVTRIAQLVGSKLGISQQDMETLTQAALIHDLGKVDLDGKTFVQARKIISKLSPNIFLPIEQLINLLETERDRILEAIDKNTLLTGDLKSEALTAIRDKFQEYIDSYKDLYKHHEVGAQKLEEKTGIVIDPESDINIIARQHGRPKNDIADSHKRFLAGILIVADIIDSTQNAALNDYYGREPNLDHTVFGLFPSLQRAYQIGRIDKTIFDLVNDLILVQENDELLGLIAAARSSQLDEQSITPEELNRLKENLREYFRINIVAKKETPVAQEPVQKAEPAISEQKPVDSSEVQPVVEPVVKNVVVTPMEGPEVKIETIQEEKPQTPVMSQDEINSIFENFTPMNPQPLKEYLDYQNINPNSLPNPISIYKNDLFRPLRQNGQSPRDIFVALSNIAQSATLSIFQTAQLQSILEKTNYVRRVTADKDVILLDIDTFGLSTQESSANERYRTTLLQYINELMARYSENQRNLKLVVFSEKMNSWEVKSIMGNLLSAKFDQVYGREMLAPFATITEPEMKYVNFMISLSTYYDVNRVNMKVFSNKSEIMDTAKSLGTILADRDGDILDAITIFANIHPKKSANLFIKNTGDTLSDLLKARNMGYYSMAGEELTLKRNVPKMRNIDTQYLFDKAA